MVNNMPEPQHQWRVQTEYFGRIEKARIYATAAHRAIDQRRKYTNDPYIVHPTEVAHIVMTVPHVTEMVMASYLHDVVEDTAVTLQDILIEFGPLVASYVAGLTNVAKPADGNRQQRFEINCKHLAAGSAEVQTIKVADLISNTSTIVQYDRHFAPVYLKEKTIVLELLTKADASLRCRAYETINAAIDQLEKSA